MKRRDVLAMIALALAVVAVFATKSVWVSPLKKYQIDPSPLKQWNEPPSDKK